MNPRFLPPFLLLAGACDALTGLLLLVSPLFTLDLMGIPVHPTEPVYLQFIGAFVFAVGSSYFRPFLHRDPAAFHTAARHTLAATAWIRVCIASFTVVALARHDLHARWVAVTATDVSLALLQLFWLTRFRSPHD